MQNVGKALVVVGMLMGAWSQAEAKMKAPQAETMLTTGERWCQAIGQTALSQGQARDRGVSYLTMVSYIRQAARTPPIIEDFEPLALASLRLVYASPSVSPETLQQQVEMICIRRMDANTSPATRY